MTNICCLNKWSIAAPLVALMLVLASCNTDREQKSGLIIFLTDQTDKEDEDTNIIKTTTKPAEKRHVKKSNAKPAEKTENPSLKKNTVQFNSEILNPGENAEQRSYLQKGYALIEANKNKEALRVYQQLLVKYPDCYTALCKVSYLYAYLGNKTDDNALKKQYLEKSIEYANEALAMRPNDAESNYVKALAEGYLGSTTGMRKRVEHYKKMKYHLDKAIKSEPANDKIWFALGVWHSEISQMNRVEYKMAKLIIGTDAAQANYHKAAKSFENAAKYNPDMLVYHYHLGKTLLKANQKNLAKQHLEKAVMLQASNPDDKEHQVKAKEILAGI